MAIDIKKIRENYSRLDDSKLESIAKFETASLSSEVQLILIEEIKRRGLDENLLSAIEVQSKGLSDEELLEITNRIKSLSCPVCGKANKGLMGGIIRRVRGYAVVCLYECKTIIACQTCIDLERDHQLIMNSLLGWWGIPLGLFRTPQVIVNHFIDNRKKETISTQILSDFVGENIGELITHLENEQELIEVINHMNSIHPRTYFTKFKRTDTTLRSWPYSMSDKVYR